ncbi:ABC transporter permease subunit [Azospirillum sp.]|uniref:ABC transporter permease subunit n=1 Tax=Azospirillum sp. TaxID=34012 RepID=UPI003D74890E
MTTLLDTATLLLFGLPDQQPGGLLLTVLLFLATGGAAVLLGLLYATAATALPLTALPLQAASAVLRGVPPLLLVFVLAHLVSASMLLAGMLALALYSFSHTGEILRSFVAAYPPTLAAQARIMGVSPWREWLTLRLPWALWRGLPALLTHWASLLKDTGALVVIGIGELTTVAKLLSEARADWSAWVMVLGLAAAFYLATTLLVLKLLPAALRALLCVPRG